MIECWRWFGPNDPISLREIRQTGATGIVTALHDLPNGTVWSEAAIKERREMIEAAGLSWQVVESIPVHEDIKTGAAGWERYAEAWAESLANLARQGISTICYNFMPVLDWTRTDLTYELPDGAKALRFDHVACAAFDLFLLQRPGAEADYSAADRAAATAWYDRASPAERDALVKNIIAGLPGSEESYTLDQFRARLAAYDGIDAAALRAQLGRFLERVLPVAQAEGARLALHPDDPPRALFGLPRIVSTQEDYVQILAMHSVPENGVTLCAGSLGARAGNDLPGMIRAFGSRIHFAHLRSVRREADARSFHEDAHLQGSTDMVAIVEALLALEAETGVQIPMRPDHGHMILSDLTGTTTPGYPAIGRLRGLAELRGLILGLSQHQPNRSV